MREWSNEELLKWMSGNDFADYAKVVRYNEYNGSEFCGLGLDKKWMRETLGLFRDDLQVKLITEINQS